MKRVILYIILFAAVFIAPVEKADVGKLQPVELVYLAQYNDQIVLKTDMGDVGVGKTVIDALANLKETASGIVYLDTAEFVLIDDDAKAYINDLKQILKRSVKACFVQGEIDLKAAAKYLSAHGKIPLLRQWNQEKNIPILTNEKILEKSQKSS